MQHQQQLEHRMQHQQLLKRTQRARQGDVRMVPLVLMLMLLLVVVVLVLMEKLARHYLLRFLCTPL
jgi:hypothetical protein